MIRGVPYDAEVEYLESTGTQWIDTGYVGNSQTTEFDIHLYTTGQSKISMGIIGVRNSVDTRFCWANGSITQIQVGYGNSYKNSGLAMVSNREFRFSSKISNGTITYLIENKTVGVSDSLSFTTYDFSTTLGIRFLNIGTLDGFVGRLYSCKLYELGALAMDLTPVRFTNEQGVSEGATYDRVSRKLFRNSGTGAFTIGPDVATPVMGLHFTRPYVAAYTARSYVQEGLIAMWDGVENAGWGVHDPSATTWKDLIASSDLTVANTAFWDGGNCLANSDTHTMAYRGFNSDSVLARYCQIECVFASANATPTVNGSILVNANFSTTSADTVSLAVENVRGFPLNLRFWQGRRGVALEQWQSPLSISFSKHATGTNITYAFINGVKASFTDTNTGGVGGVVGLAIGGQYAGNRQGGRAFHGKVYAVRLYSRALTADEVAANHAIDKARFNLP